MSLTRIKKFNKNFSSFRSNPDYENIKQVYFSHLDFSIASARKLLNMVKYTTKNEIKKSSFQSNEKLKKIIGSYDIFFKSGQSIDEMNVKLKKLTSTKSYNQINKDQINILLSNLDKTKKYMLKVVTNNGEKDVHFTINRNSQGFKKIINKNFIENITETADSDKWILSNYDKIINFEIEEVITTSIKRKMNRNVGKFGFYNNHNGVDLSEYQIYNKNNIIDHKNCLIYSLEKEGLTEDKINKLIIKFSSIEKTSSNDICLKTFDYIKQTEFENVAKLIDRHIIVSVYSEPNIVNHYYGVKKDDEESINLAIYKNHIFNNKLTKYKKYAITNYETLKDKKDWNLYSELCGKKSDGKLLRVLEVIRYLDNNNYLSEIPHQIELTDNVKIFTSSDLLANIDDDQQKFIYTEPKEMKKNIYFADLENINKIDSLSIVFLAGIISEKEDDEPSIYTGENCISKMFDYVIERNNKDLINIVYFHNMKYDFSLMKNQIKIINICEKDGAVYSVQLKYRGVMITLKDSYKVFPEKLTKFSDAFALSPDLNKKEAINYDYYNEKTIKEESASIKMYKKGIKKNEHELFMENIKPFIINSLRFNHMNYYRYYLKFDVLVLKHGMKAFNQCIIETFNKSIYNFLTISSFADDYFKSREVYDGIYEVKGGLKKYLSKAVYGGRVNVCSEFKKKVIIKTLNDFDGVSLYPSAIYRLCEEFGLPIGSAKRLLDKKIIDKDYYVVDIEITKINKKQQNPFIAIKTDLSINYVNEIPEGGLITTIDRITLEDYIKFHEIEYRIIDGVYWNEGFNKKFACIKDVFDERVRQKSLKTVQGDIKQQIYKLVMNSAYGKTLLKSSCEKNIVVNKKDFNNYVFNNFNTIKYAKKLSDEQYIITQYESDQSYNRVHCGIMILGMSRKIMNEVMDTASDNQINIYYQDTDSMHIEDDQIEKLSKLYDEKYNRKLIGKHLGQFHQDFSHSNKLAKNIISIKSIFLGKKSYIDYLQGTLPDGSIETCMHCRMKGINEIALLNKAKEYKHENMNDNIFNVYEDLSNDKDIEFILNPDEKPSFNFTSDGVKKIESNKFKRLINFKSEKIKNEDRKQRNKLKRVSNFNDEEDEDEY
jgi:hypothetical protein